MSPVKYFKKLLLPIFVLFAYSTSVAETTAAIPAGWTDGSGGTISNLAELRWLSETSIAWDENWTLSFDINASDTKTWNVVGVDTLGFTPIGDHPSGTRSAVSFTGSFDGKGFSIDGLYSNQPGSYTGLFGHLSDAHIENLQLTNCNITGSSQVGGLAGYKTSSDISRVQVTGTISGINDVGGLIGLNFAAMSDIIFCSASGTVSGDENVGGLVGHHSFGHVLGYNNSKIEFSYSTSQVVGDRKVGGLVGYSSIPIVNSYATGDVTGDRYVGGLVGHQEDDALLKNCYAIGSVTGNTYTAGLVGYGSINNIIIESFHDSITSGIFNGNGNVSHITIGKTTSQFKESDQFPGWDFDDIWEIRTEPAIDANARPYLKMESNDIRVSADLSIEGVARVLGESFYTAGDTAQLWILDIYDGIDFKCWTLNGDTLSTMNSITFVVRDDITYNLVAHFEESYSFTGGTGTVGDPYQIANLEQLYFLSNVKSLWSSHFKLVNNIDATSTRNLNLVNGVYKGFKPIGDDDIKGSRERKEFWGSFDGNGYYISNLYINRPTENYIGMFGSASSVLIKNVKLIKADITGYNYVGGLVGEAGQYFSITNSFVSGSVSGSYRVGGLIGRARTSVDYDAPGVHQCYSVATIHGSHEVGGLIGRNHTLVLKSFSASDVTALFSYAGGLIGVNGGDVLNSFANGSVATDMRGGGFIGSNGTSMVDKNYAIGPVTVPNAPSSMGAFFGTGDTPVGTHNYYDSTRCMVRNPSGTIPIDGGIYGKAPQDFSETGYLGYLNTDSIWTIKTIPFIDNVARPYLHWMNTVTIQNGIQGTITGSANQIVYSPIDYISPVLAVGNKGYDFASWNDSQGNIISTQNPLEINGIIGDSILIPIFAMALGDLSSESNQQYSSDISYSLNTGISQSTGESSFALSAHGEYLSSSQMSHYSYQSEKSSVSNLVRSSNDSFISNNAVESSDMSTPIKTMYYKKLNESVVYVSVINKKEITLLAPSYTRFYEVYTVTGELIRSGNISKSNWVSFPTSGSQGILCVIFK